MLRRSQAKGTIAKYYTEIKPAEEVPHQGLFIDANCCLNQEYTQWIGEQEVIKAFFAHAN